MADLVPVHQFGGGAEVRYFRTSDLYGETGGLISKTGIKKVKDADLTGKETIIPVKELLRTGDLFRLGIRYKTTGGKQKSAKILVTTASMVKLFGTVAGDKIEGATYSIAGVSKGTINNIHALRRATTY